MSHLPPHRCNGNDPAITDQRSSDSAESHQPGTHDHPFNIFDESDQTLFIEAVNRVLPERDVPYDEQEQRTVRLELDGDYEYVQAVVERLRRALNVTWVSAEPDRCRGRSVAWFVVVEWPELIPETDAGKPLTRAQWNALERLYRQRHVRSAELTRSATLESLVSRRPALARAYQDEQGVNVVEITETGVSYYEIYKELYLRRFWSFDAPPRDTN